MSAGTSESRRAGAVAASVIAVVTISLFAIAPWGRDAQPAPRSPPESSSAPAGAEFASFEFPEEAQWREAAEGHKVERQVEAAGGRWRLPCGQAARGVVGNTELLTVEFARAEEGQWRQLALHADPAAAERVVSRMRSFMDDCSKRKAAAGVSSWQIDDAKIAASGFTVRSTTFEDFAEPTHSFLVVVTYGRAVYLAGHGGATTQLSERRDEVLPELLDAANATFLVIENMFNEPSAAPAEATFVPPGPAKTVTLPPSFRFVEEVEDAGWRNEHEENKIERTAALSTQWAIDPCWPKKTTYQTDAKRTSMLSLTRSGPEYGDTLQLALYPDAATAAAVLVEFENALNACKAVFTDAGKHTLHRSVTQPLPDFTGGLLGLGYWDADGRQTAGSEHFVAYQLGNAVFVRLIAGEGARPAGEPDPTKDVVIDSAKTNRVEVCRLLGCVEAE